MRTLELRCSFVFLAGLLCLLLGCGDARPVPHKVEGLVTLDGKPLTTGNIMFHPDAGRAALGKIDAAGMYQLTTLEAGDGAVPGHYVVTIEATEVTGGAPKSFEEELRGVKPGTLTYLVPPLYGDRATTTLQAEVEAKPNRIDFKLLSKPAETKKLK